VGVATPLPRDWTDWDAAQEEGRASGRLLAQIAVRRMMEKWSGDMPEPLTVLIAGALKAWLMKKASDAAWNRIYGYFRRSAVQVQIESALQA
jgi:hypothetical protein